jgi:DNA-binding IclR family transcriptional regulator
MGMAEADKYSIKTTKFSLEILDAIHELEGATVSELSNHLDKSKSSVFKHLRTLDSSGFLAKNGGEYRISLSFLRYGLDARRRVHLDRIANPDFEWLAEATDARISLAVNRENRIVCLRSAKASDIGIEGTREGRSLDHRTTALGKAVVAYIPEEDRLNFGTQPTTSNRETHQNSDWFETLRTVRDQGFATSTHDGDPTRSTLAASIFGPDENVAGSIGVTVDGEPMDREHLMETYGDVVVNAAQRISKRFRIRRRTAEAD